MEPGTGPDIRYTASPRRATAIKITLTLSILLHGALVLGLQKIFPTGWLHEPMKTFHVELLRPPMDPDEAKGSASAELKEPDPVEKKHEKTEDTISLDTKDKRYVSYAATLKQSILRHWRYPRKAKNDLIEGEVRILFSLDRGGHLLALKLLQPSAYDILNTETERAIRAAAPYAPFPGSVTVKRLNIRANFQYRLTGGP